MNYFPLKLTITWIKESYKNEELTPLALAEEIVKRAEANKEKNIWIVPPSLAMMKGYIEALEDKKQSDYPLWGIPFAIKDNIDLAGVQTTAACESYGYLPKESATVVQKLIDAGAIPVGKTNLDQFATGLVGTRSPYGEVHNALNPELISGGSSSGSAVAVALGMVAFSLGTDTAGSGRVPAALNGLVGYKPSLGAWSTKGVVPACASLDCINVFANSLEDAELVNGVARGFDETCAWSRVYDKPFKQLPKKICLAKNGVSFYGPFKAVYEKKWEEAVSRIKDLGITVEYIDYTMFQKAASILYDGPWVAERWKDLGEFVDSHLEAIFPVTKTILKSGSKPEHTAESLFSAIHELQDYRMKTKRLLKDAVLIMPTAGGTFTREEVRNNPIATNSQMGLYTNHCNLLDLCAISIPTKMKETNLPFGITIFGLADSEGLILGAAKTFLEAEPMKVAVCGLHKKGYPLESQLVELGAHYLESTQTAAFYKLYSLDTRPIKPGMCRVGEGGKAIEVDLYELPIAKFGAFMQNVSEPLAMGTITLKDNEKVVGFLCEDYATRTAKDITQEGKFILTK